MGPSVYDLQPEKDCYDHVITCKNDALQVPVRRTRGATPSQRVQQHNARGSVTGRCWDDFWWRSPACRRHSRKCTPLMTGGTRWGTEEISLVVVKRVFSSRWLRFWLGLWVWPGYDSGCPGGPGTQGTREGPREAQGGPRGDQGGPRGGPGPRDPRGGPEKPREGPGGSIGAGAAILAGGREATSLVLEGLHTI